MSKYRYAAKVDANQPDIVKELRNIPGVTVQVGMEDILIGHDGRNYQIEIKEPGTVSKVTGEILDSKIKPSQHKLRQEWTGQYDICWNLEQILKIIGVKK